MSSKYIINPTVCRVASLKSWVYSNPANFIPALTTPMSAPPAMNPEAKNVPLSKRALFRAVSFERLPTYQLISPQMTKGVFSSNGMNIPKANAKAGTFSHVSRTARIAPIP